MKRRRHLRDQRAVGETDAGTTASMFGHFLCWMQEPKPCSHLIGDSELIYLSSRLSSCAPAGLMRCSSLISPPWLKERKSSHHEPEYGTRFLWNSSEKAPRVYRCRNRAVGKRIHSLTVWMLAMEAIVPLSRTMREEIQNLRDWPVHEPGLPTHQ